MRKEKKEETVQQLAERLERCHIAIATDYRGLTVAQMAELRSRLRQQGVEYRVVKNTLTRFAAAAAEKEELTPVLEGPVALAFGYDDVTVPARALLEYIQSTKSTLQIKGGLLEQRALSAEEVRGLATLPPRDVLIARVMGTMQGPITGLVGALNGIIVGFVNVLNARREQLEGGSYGG
ncbi:MAG: 50S ribosomal protein L10 [Chloroflexota bacterium]|nr:50S ribosomal protein L10 [Chloroflexota bacterium]